MLQEKDGSRSEFTFAVCDLPQIESTDVVFAYRRLKPAEIATLGLRRGQIVVCERTLQHYGTLGSADHCSS